MDESASPAGINSFHEFWPFYVGEHRRRATRAWHFVGTTLALALFVTCITLGWWWGLLAVPVCGYAFAWISHLCSERNRPATFRYPLWSLAADFKMWWLIASGRMAGEVRRILEEDR
ncbi:MAG TPA: DUF962 domain-containing protein [Pirellulales bacterium]|jgi:hypothetical protein|nr:DUF962 domain-containing protein [Pirellulales bacterium]